MVGGIYVPVFLKVVILCTMMQRKINERYRQFENGVTVKQIVGYEDEMRIITNVLHVN